MKIFISTLMKNKALLLPIIIAVSTLILNLVLKGILEPKDYGFFASYFFVATTFYILGSAGYEQVITRLSELDGKVVIVCRRTMYFGFTVIMLSPLLSYFVFILFGVIDGLSFYFLVLAFIIPISSIVATIFKLQGNLIGFYLILGLWKIILLVIGFFSLFLYGFFEPQAFISISLILGFIITFLIVGFNGVRLSSEVHEYKNIIVSLVAGVSSMLAFCLFDGVDRFSIKNIFNPSIFGDYFFIFTLFFAPVGIVSAYFSAQKLNSYKVGFDLSNLKEDLAVIIKLSLVIIMGSWLLLEFLVYHDMVAFSDDVRSMIISIGFFVLVRGGYALLSMAYTVVCPSYVLINVGIVFGLVAYGSYVLATDVMSNYSILLVVNYFSFVWVVRSLIYWKLIKSEVQASE